MPTSVYLLSFLVFLSSPSLARRHPQQQQQQLREVCYSRRSRHPQPSDPSRFQNRPRPSQLHSRCVACDRPTEAANTTASNEAGVSSSSTVGPASSPYQPPALSRAQVRG